MVGVIRQNRMASASLAILVLGWIFVAAFIASGMHALYPAAWWVQTGVFCSVLFGPVAGILAVGGFMFDARKAWAVFALLLSVATTVGVVILGI